MHLLTRASLDGVTCAALITTMERISEVVFANPRDVEYNTVTVKQGDIIAKLPLHHKAALWFDNHDRAEDASSVRLRAGGKRGIADSTARLVYEYYNSPELKQYEELLRENDRIDSARLELDDVLEPKDWVLLSYTLDPFMGREVFPDYANSIVDAIRHGLTIELILEMAEVKEQVNHYLKDVEEFKQSLRLTTSIYGNVIVTDFRRMVVIPLGNRFIAFALYPDANVQVRLTLRKEKSEVRVRLGKSIFNRTCRIHLGQLAAEYGGGGLDGAAGCMFDPGEADIRIKEIVNRLKEGV